jgi:hypothetical protein
MPVDNAASSIASFQRSHTSGDRLASQTPERRHRGRTTTSRRRDHSSLRNHSGMRNHSGLRHHERSQRSGHPEVIDLTREPDSHELAHAHHNGESSSSASSLGNASRAPRFGNGHAIIDLSRVGTPDAPVSRRSPEVEFISSRALPRPLRMQPPPPSDDDIVILRENIRNPPPRPQSQLQRPNFHTSERLWAVPPHLQSFINSIIPFVSPALDYGPPAFDLGLVDFEDDSDYSSVSASASSPSEPIPQLLTPPKGYTRSTADESQDQESLFCPNCARELCEGKNELQKQIWMIKGCGHVSLPHASQDITANSTQVYCGECTLHRFKSKRKKAAVVPSMCKPFSNCVAPNCNKSTGHKQMLQMYL